MIVDPIDVLFEDAAKDYGAQEIDVDLILALDEYNQAVGEERSA